MTDILWIIIGSVAGLVCAVVLRLLFMIHAMGRTLDAMDRDRG